MPLPTPAPDEPLERFRARFMSSPAAAGEYPDVERRFAVMSSLWERRVEKAFDSEQPRDETGRWTAGGGGLSGPGDGAGRTAGAVANSPTRLTRSLSDRMGLEALDYTNDWYLVVNSYNRAVSDGRNPGVSSGVRSAVEQSNRSLDAAISRSVLTDDVTVYRGLEDARIVQHGDQLVGREFGASTFQSTSLDRAVATGFSGFDVRSSVVLEIRLKKGQNALDMAQFNPESNLSKERELLLGRGSRFRAVGFQRTPRGASSVLTLEMV